MLNLKSLSLLAFLGITFTLLGAYHLQQDPLEDSVEISITESPVNIAADYPVELPHTIPVEVEFQDVPRLWTLSPLDQVAHKASIDGMSEEERVSHAVKIRKLVKEYNSQWVIGAEPARRMTVDLLSDIATCLEINSCTKRQSTIVIGGSNHYTKQRLGHFQNEHMWARSTLDAFEALDVTFLYSVDPAETLAIYLALPDIFVNRILMHDYDLDACIGQGISQRLKKYWIDNGNAVIVARPPQSGNTTAEEEGLDPEEWSEEFGWERLRGSERSELGSVCIKRPGFEQGIPIWKIHTIMLWPANAHPLGRKFVATHEDFGNHPGRQDDQDLYYLGYSIEKWCKEYDVYPQSKRLNRAHLNGDEIHLYEEESFLFFNDNHTFMDMQNNRGIQFVADVHTKGHRFQDQGVTMLGPSNLDKFYDDVGKSNVLVGLGGPWHGSSPFYGLCMGIPYVNVVHGWNHDNPEDRSSWNTQSGAFYDTYPPYVYHVHAHNLEEYEEAIATAMATPIDRYILPHMTTTANLARHKYLLEGDWEALAREILSNLPASKRLDWDGNDRYLL